MSPGHMQQAYFYVVCAGREEAFSIGTTVEVPENVDANIPLDTVTSVGLCGEPGVTHMC